MMPSLPAWWPTQLDTPHDPAQPNLWTGLQSALDIKQITPAQADGIISKEMQDGSGHHFMLKNARTHTYARLSPEEFWLWQRMDGGKTIQQIVLAYFMEFKSFAFAAVLGLIARLTELQMLHERPHDLYGDMARALQERKPAYKITWLARVVFTKEWSIKGLDGHLNRIHQYGGWIIFTPLAQITLLLVSVIGLFLFFPIAQQPRYNLFGEGLGTIMFRLGLIAYIPIVIHEFGHAITAKHFGCEVYKGGAMLYYGLPAAFVDTTDVWMHGKKARLAVTWAGPYTGFIIGGICTFCVYFIPTLSLATAIFLLQISLVAIITSSYNLLPLVKMDGYYLLADALEIPRLRERSMEFLAKGLRIKLAKREKWTREEWIFLFFGILAFLSTFYFTYSAIRFWDNKTTSSISRLFSFHGDWMSQAVNVLTVLLAISSISYSLYLLARNGSGLVQWLAKVGFLSTRTRSALVVLTGALILTFLPPVLLPTLSGWFAILGGVLAFAFAAWIAATIYINMRGSIHAWMWLLAALGLLAGALGAIGQINASWSGAGLGLQLIGFTLLVVSFVLAGRLWRGLNGSWRQISLALTVLGTLVWVAAISSFPELRILAGLLILGGLLHWGMRPATQIKAMDVETTGSTRQKLVRTFDAMKKTILSEFELDFGAKTRAWVESGAYHPRKESVGKTEFASTHTSMTPGDYGSALALILEETLAGVERAAGSQYVRRALAYSYDHLDWELREIAEDYLLKYVKHAAELSDELLSTRDDLDTFLRSVPMFISLNDSELSALGKQFKAQRFQPNQNIIQAGEAGDSFYILRMGRAMVLSASGEQLNTLGRGDYFGETALLVNQKRNATVRASTPVEVLRLSKSHFDKLIRNNVNFDEKARMEFHRLGVLRQIPLFAQFEGWELKLLANRLESVDLPDSWEVFRQGELGHSFYIIESGKVSVQIDGVERAPLGAGEYFGEIALLMDTPRTATVITTQPTTLLELKSDDFQELVRDSNVIKQALERTSSRRTLSNDRWNRTEQSKQLGNQPAMIEQA